MDGNRDTPEITQCYLIRISARLNIPLYPKFVVKQTSKDGNLTLFKISMFYRDPLSFIFYQLEEL